jgi:hypothetical protein
MRPEGEQIVGGFRRGARGTNDGAVIVAQHLEPGPDVVGVPHGRHDAERGADEGAGYLGTELFLGIERGTEPARQITAEPGGMAAPMAIMPISA